MPSSLNSALPFLLFIVLLAVLLLLERLIARSRSPLQIRPHLSNLFGAVLVLLICGYGTGLNMFFPLLIVLPVRIHRHFKARGQALLQRLAWRNTAIWLAVFAAVSLAHIHYAHQARAGANHWIELIEGFHNAHGRYPQAGEIGFPGQPRMFGPNYMFKDDDTPVLFYRSSFVAFDTLQYDFETRQWQRY